MNFTFKSFVEKCFIKGSRNGWSAVLLCPLYKNWVCSKRRLPAPSLRPPSAGKMPGSGSASARGQSPSERAAFHASKIRLRESRKSATPGPGAYNATTPRSARAYGSAFKSGSQRMQVEEATGDPGAYDAFNARDLAALSARSFGRSNRAGSGAFGASSARDMKLDIMGEDTPGPGSYRDNAKEFGRELFAKGPSSAFRSSSSQRAKTRLQDTPGAGSYDPNMRSVEPGSANSGAGMRSKASRFTAERTTTDQGVGPGSYENHADGSLAASVAKSVERMSRSNPGFGSRQPARELPYQKEQADMPGPGAYDSARGERAEGHASAFKSGTQRLQVEEVTGDPGAYDPNSNRDLAHQANSSFGRSNRAGSGAFGASSARDMKLDIMGEDTPGPGSYKSKKDLAEKQHMPSSAFRSSSAQRGKTKSQDTPGAGSYDPNMATVEPGSANSGAGMRSKASRFTNERTTTDQGVGPGSYDPRGLSGGHRNAISGSVLDSINLGASATFRSDTVRQMDFS